MARSKDSENISEGGQPAPDFNIKLSGIEARYLLRVLTLRSVGVRASNLQFHSSLVNKMNGLHMNQPAPEDQQELESQVLAGLFEAPDKVQ